MTDQPAASPIEARLSQLEHRVAVLEAVEGVRHTVSDYARALDERRPELLEQIFTDDCHLVTVPWGADTRGKPRMLRAFDRYWARFANPRRYYANEAITVEGNTATAFMYWFVTQDDGDRSAIGWGTYDWTFRREEARWKIAELVIHVLAMTTLDRGWAIPDRIMSPFPRSSR
ncbi:MAG TPA: nuclear transport factor 2 family protein [Candidatus Methylomirabilis sp.]|nr:nuclear transport factor 2 family protein [Candidatus Methylomirabilis sp.]